MSPEYLCGSDIVLTKPQSAHSFDPRTLLVAVTLIAAVLGAPASATAQPAPGQIGHVIVVMMENRSFDHFLGWTPGANGQQAGLTYMESDGTPHGTYRLGPSDYQGCSHPDPNHDYCGGRLQWNVGLCDGWLFDCGSYCIGCPSNCQNTCPEYCIPDCRQNDIFAIGYYTDQDLPFYAQAVPNWTVCDRYFAPIMASTWPNRIYQYAADTDRINNDLDQDGDQQPDFLTLPTIFDHLAAAGISARYYFTDAPVVVLWGAQYLPISRHVSQFFAEAASGTLPQVSFVDPALVLEAYGASCDDHPYADVRCGQKFLNLIYEAVITSPNWNDSVLVINYDEWGGFYDHVDPDGVGRPPVPPAQSLVDTDQPGLRGFRVPCTVVSPWAPRGAVAHGAYDHTSVLKMIEWNWNVANLTIRDAQANNLADLLTLSPPDFNAPHFTVPTGPFNGPCQPVPPNPASDKWWDLYLLARNMGFPVPLQLQITARDDIPGPVDIVLEARNAAEETLSSQTLTWMGDNNEWTTQSAMLPPGSATLRFTFIHDACNAGCPGDPDADRNAYIDSFSVSGLFTRQAEDFDRTGGTDPEFPGCEPATVDGREVVTCGNENDWVEYDIEAPPIPTVSGWGIVVMLVLVLAMGTLVHARRSRRTPFIA